MTIPPDLKREGCCADVRKPCTFHEGYSDGWDAHGRLADITDGSVRRVSEPTWRCGDIFACCGPVAPRNGEKVRPRDERCNEPAGFIDLESGAFLDGAMGRGILA